MIHTFGAEFDRELHPTERAELVRVHPERKAQLARAELIIDVQKKLSQMLGLPETPSDEST